MKVDFKCRRCGKCCRWPGYVRLEPDEIASIAGLLGVDEAEFIAEQTRLTGDRRGLSLLENTDGSCPFLEETAGGAICRIQAAKPRQCRNFPLGWNFPGWEEECAGSGKGNAVAEEAGSAFGCERDERGKIMKKLGSAIVISGPSGVGKSTVCGRVRERLPELGFSVSCTTRQPRPGEIDGVHYHFLAHEEFERRIAAGEFVEYARVFDHIYGTLKSEVIARVEAGQDVFLDIDVQGAMQIKAAAADDALLRRVADFIFIAPPSAAVLEARLRGRASDSEEQIALRLATSRRELEFWREYDFLVVNADLETAVDEITAIIRSVRLRTTKITGEFLV